MDRWAGELTQINRLSRPTKNVTDDPIDVQTETASYKVAVNAEQLENAFSVSVYHPIDLQIQHVDFFCFNMILFKKANYGYKHM